MIWTKLRWMNGEYMKRMDPDRFYERALPLIRETVGRPMDYKKIAGMVQTRIEVFPDIPELIDFLKEIPGYDSSMYTHKKMKTTEESSLALLKEVLPLLRGAGGLLQRRALCHAHRLGQGERL